MVNDLVKDNPTLKIWYLDEAEWNEIEIFITLLEPMAKATPILLSSTHPTMGDLHIIFPTILSILHPNIKLSLFDSEIAITIHELLYSAYTQYEEFDISITKDDIDSPRNYFRKYRNEKLNTTSNVLKEYLIAIEENSTSVSSEEMFFKAKNTINPIHNRLSEENASASFCLKT
ncbi:1288_t:CDS:2, partial [Cetraspora pellucida]